MQGKFIKKMIKIFRSKNVKLYLKNHKRVIDFMILILKFGQNRKFRFKMHFGHKSKHLLIMKNFHLLINFLSENIDLPIQNVMVVLGLKMTFFSRLNFQVNSQVFAVYTLQAIKFQAPFLWVHINCRPTFFVYKG